MVKPDPATVEARAKIVDAAIGCSPSNASVGCARPPATDGEAEKLAERLVEIPRDLCWTEDRGSHRNLQIGELAHQAAARFRSQDRKDVSKP